MTRPATGDLANTCPQLGPAGLPGGAVEVGETWLEAAVRECREETGWHVTVTGLFGACSDLAPLFPPDRPILSDFVSERRSPVIG